MFLLLTTALSLVNSSAQIPLGFLNHWIVNMTTVFVKMHEKYFTRWTNSGYWNDYDFAWRSNYIENTCNNFPNWLYVTKIKFVIKHLI